MFPPGLIAIMCKIRNENDENNRIRFFEENYSRYLTMSKNIKEMVLLQDLLLKIQTLQPATNQQRCNQLALEYFVVGRIWEIKFFNKIT